MALFRPPKDLLVLLLITGSWATIYGNFFFDTSLEHHMERTMESITGAAVEIDDLKFYFRGPSLSMEGMRIADPQDSLRNLIEIGRLGFHIEARPLFWKSLFLKNLFIGDIQFGAARSTAAHIYHKDPARPGWIREAKKNLQNQLDVPPLLEVLSGENPANALIPYLDIEPINKLSQMRSQIDSVSREWIRFRTGLQTRLTNSYAPATNSLSDASAGPPKRLGLMRVHLDSMATSILNSLARLRRKASELADMTAANSLTLPLTAHCLKVTPELTNKVIFGEALVRNADKLLQYIGMVRKLIAGKYQKAEHTKIMKPRRFAGQTILLPLTHGPPRLSIRKIDVECPPRNQERTRDVFVRGTIRGSSSSPNEPDNRLSFRMRTKNANPQMIVVMGALDHSGVTPFEQFQIGVSGTDMLQLDLLSRPFLPQKILISRGTLSGNFEITGSQFNAHLSLTSINARFTFADPVDAETPLAREIRTAFQSQGRFNLAAMMLTSDDELEIGIHSGMGGLLAKPLQQSVQDLLRREHSRFASNIPRFVTSEKEDILQLIQRHEENVENQLTALRSGLSRQSSQ